MYERHVVHPRAEMRNQFAHPFSALAARSPIPRTLHYRAGSALKQLHFAAGIELLSAAFDQFGFVIERVALAGRAGHKQLDHAFGVRPVMQATVPLGPWRAAIGE